MLAVYQLILWNFPCGGFFLLIIRLVGSSRGKGGGGELKMSHSRRIDSFLLGQGQAGNNRQGIDTG